MIQAANPLSTQEFATLQRIAEAVLTVLSTAPLLTLSSNTLSDLLDGLVLQPGQKSSSALDAIRYVQGSQGHPSSGCQPHVDKGLLTVILADAGGLQVISLF